MTIVRELQINNYWGPYRLRIDRLVFAPQFNDLGYLSSLRLPGAQPGRAETIPRLL